MTDPDRLAHYRAKRDFTSTGEPAGKRGRKRRSNLSFVVQKHDARRLHYDFRLEWHGVLLSWAVTKGPSLKPSDKRLAVQTEDHPVAYGDFEGNIPKGQYGGGTVMLWDQGTWEPQEDPEKGLAEGKLKFVLKGDRMQGGWTLVRMGGKNSKKSGKQNWLLIKEKDDYADAEKDLTADFATSVATERTMAEIENRGATYLGTDDGELKTRGGNGNTGGDADNSTTKKSGKGKRRRSANPKFTKPQLATLVSEAPTGDDWLFENKFDGYRCLASVGSRGVAMYTRSGLDWRDKFASIADELANLNCKNALLDGEITAERDGRADFSALQEAIKHGGELTYYVFDILHLDGESLTDRPLRERKRILEHLFRSSVQVKGIELSSFIESDGEAALGHVCEAGGEGIICKKADARYSHTRNKNWLKVKCTRRQEFVIAGFSPSSKKARPFASILVGQYENGKLVYKGRIGTGFDDEELHSLAGKFKKIGLKRNPFDQQASDIPNSVLNNAHWLQPSLVTEIDFTEITAAGHVRHGVYLGLREDKDAKQVTPERATGRGQTAGKSQSKPAKGSSGARPARKNSSSPSGAGKHSEKGREKAESEHVVAGVDISHPDREVFPSAGLTKFEIAQFIGDVGERMLAIAGERPVSLVRCPEGLKKECFFQRHAGKGFPDSFKSLPVPEKNGKKAEYFYFDSRAGLVAAIQMGALEFHMWGARNDRLERPDRIVFDLDPDPSVAFAEVKKAAFELRDLLEQMELASVPLLTGGKGIHVCVPLRRTLDWDTAKLFAKTFAHVLAERYPERYTATMSKARRKDKIFIDWLRNERSATAIVPYSVRAREGAPVAVPLTWRELKSAKSAADFSVKKARARLKKDCPYLAALQSPSTVTKDVLRHMEEY